MDFTRKLVEEGTLEIEGSEATYAWKFCVTERGILL